MAKGNFKDVFIKHKIKISYKSLKTALVMVVAIYLNES